MAQEIDSSAGVMFPFYDDDLSILYLAGKDLVNIVIEVTLDRQVVKCVEYQLPANRAPSGRSG